ncbi:MAG: hypothetical protein AAFQ06_05365 [Pseudomonadota bacterium]
MNSLNRDDIRAAVASGVITEKQAAGIVMLSDARQGARQHISGLDEPFELFRGFNEIFIVVGLSILFAGWWGITGLSLFTLGASNNGYVATIAYGVITAVAVCVIASYFTLRRRMVAPSILLSIVFGLAAVQTGFGFAWAARVDTPAVFAIGAGTATLGLSAYYLMFRVPFAMLLIALGVFATCFALLTFEGGLPDTPADIFLLSGSGAFALLTLGLGLIGFFIAMAFDMSDPHRVSRRASSGFWLHVISAPAIVNTVALTLLETGSLTAQLGLVVFILALAIVAILIDRRSFLVAGVGYLVAVAFAVVEGGGFLVIFGLGAVLVLLGAKWDVIRASLMQATPDFPGKTRLPPSAAQTLEAA